MLRSGHKLAVGEVVKVPTLEHLVLAVVKDIPSPEVFDMAVAEEDVPSSSMALALFGQCDSIAGSWVFFHPLDSAVGKISVEESPSATVRAQSSIANGNHSGGSKNLV